MNNNSEQVNNPPFNIDEKIDQLLTDPGFVNLSDEEKIEFVDKITLRV
jgi:hypothetical protein